MNLHSDYHKIAQGKQGKKSGQLTALQKWKLEHPSYLKPYYKQGQKAGKESQGTGVLGGPVQPRRTMNLMMTMKTEVMKAAPASQGKKRLKNFQY